MTAANSKITYTAAEVAELIRPLTQSVEALQKENAELKRKLEHMNEVLANAQRVQYGQSSEKKSYVLSEDQMSLFNEAESCQDHKVEEPAEETFTVKAHARKKKRTIDELARNLPVEEVIIDLRQMRRHLSAHWQEADPPGNDYHSAAGEDPGILQLHLCLRSV